MIRYAIIFFVLLLFAGPAYGQAPEKRFVGNCSFASFSVLADSSYRGNITRFDDRLGDGYNLTQLTTDYEIFDGRGLVFEIDTIHSSTNFTADVSVTAKIDRGFEPFGSGQVYYPTANGLIPPSSQEQAGLSPTQKARIDRHNVVVMQSLIGGRDSVYQITNVPDTTTLSPVVGDAFINTAADTLGLYDGAGWVLFFGGSGGAGDNLGDHTATEDIQMAGFNIDMLGGAVVGGSGTGGDLNLISTSGAGDGSDDIIFFTGNNGGDERVRIEGDGDVGIGTSNALQTLHVAGTARITGSDGIATTITGRDGDGDINNVTVGSGLDLTTGTLTANDTVTTLLQDSILVYSFAGTEVGRDTVQLSGTGGGDCGRFWHN